MIVMMMASTPSLNASSRFDLISAHSTVDARSPNPAAVRNPDGAYQLFRIGDAVTSCNVHAVILGLQRLLNRRL
jgi:hypothetical protein